MTIFENLYRFTSKIKYFRDNLHRLIKTEINMYDFSISLIILKITRLNMYFNVSGAYVVTPFLKIVFYNKCNRIVEWRVFCRMLFTKTKGN